MNYDDKLNVPEPKNYTSDIIEFLSKNYPEYLLPNSSVTVDFIKIVDKVQNIIMCEFEEDDDEDIIEDKYVQDILNHLPEEAISQPLSFNTIEAIQEEFESIYAEMALDYLKSHSKDPLKFNNRGAEYADRGMIKEALEDFNRAILLNPDNDGPVWNRACLFMENGMDGLAVKDFLVIYEKMMKPDCVTNSILSWIHLSEIFIKYNMPYQAITSILSGIQDFNKHQLPNITENDGRFINITIKTKDLKEWSTSLELTDFEDIISMVKEFDLKHKNDLNLSPLIESIKHEILFTRVAIGF